MHVPFCGISNPHRGEATPPLFKSLVLMRFFKSVRDLLKIVFNQAKITQSNIFICIIHSESN